MFHTEDRPDRLHELTGGWPILVDRAHRLREELGDPDEVCAAWRASARTAPRLVDSPR
ncbi:hypothetical protein [Streptomyces sp. NPDC048002]|uniref:hypothetical protein n=1 Tax=Streptomyces sp. NPDC048002 TaxID=3154344 RepID=UPI0033D2AE70